MSEGWIHLCMIKKKFFSCSWWTAICITVFMAAATFCRPMCYFMQMQNDFYGLQFYVAKHELSLWNMKLHVEAQTVFWSFYFYKTALNHAVKNVHLITDAFVGVKSYHLQWLCAKLFCLFTWVFAVLLAGLDHCNTWAKIVLVRICCICCCS